MLTTDEQANVSVHIVADSANPAGKRLTTMVWRYPRFIHAEVMTHRAVSRNAASSRAIPTHRMIANLKAHGAVPEYWGRAQAGMQTGGQLEPEALAACRELWDGGKMLAIDCAEAMLAHGLHKSVANRVLEPWVPYTALVSATEWDNFFQLRAHKAAEPTLQVLAYRALAAYLSHAPAPKDWGEWHIPFGERMPDGLDTDTRIKVATARAARLSYETFEGEIDIDKDLDLYRRLMVEEPLHASPGEHVAMAESHLWLSREGVVVKDAAVLTWETYDSYGRRDDMVPIPYTSEGRHQGNFLGWTQHRKMLHNENVRQADLRGILEDKPDWITL